MIVKQICNQLIVSYILSGSEKEFRVKIIFDLWRFFTFLLPVLSHCFSIWTFETTLTLYYLLECFLAKPVRREQDSMRCYAKQSFVHVTLLIGHKVFNHHVCTGYWALSIRPKIFPLANGTDFPVWTTTIRTALFTWIFFNDFQIQITNIGAKVCYSLCELLC